MDAETQARFDELHACEASGKHDTRPGSRCERCGWINAVRRPRRPRSSKRSGRAAGGDGPAALRRLFPL